MQRTMLAFNTGGPGSLDSLRMHRLVAWLDDRDITCFDLDKRDKRGSAKELSRLLNSRKWDLVYQEGTGIAGGLPLIRAARSRGVRYIYSIGDPVGGFFQVTRGMLYGAAMERYERELARHSAGVIGWTPYLTGRALTMGAPRAATVEGAAALDIFRPLPPQEKVQAKERYNLPQEHIVCGVVGSLTWTSRQQYCYGLELIETLKRLNRSDVSILIVGDGDGRRILEERLPSDLKSRVVFTGRVPEAEVVTAMNAMDIGFITQTLDALGNFRLTTKMPEYLACGLPVAVSPIPGYFDYVGEAGWALPPYHPASDAFARGCALWLDKLDRAEIAQRATHCRPIAEMRFAYEVVGPRFARFIDSIEDGSLTETSV